MIESCSKVVTETTIPGVSVRRGKVRDIYELADSLLLVATDRISAYDVVLPTAIPGKGEMLTRLSRFWFQWLGDSVPNHFLGMVEDQAPDGLEDHLDQLRHRTTVCRKCEVVPIECVVRGYITGSGWVEYQRDQTVCGIDLPAGLKQCQKLDKPIFTPATKEDEGHDINISFERACELVGTDVMTKLRDMSIDIYKRASEYAATRGIIIADTKFEFGVHDGKLLLIDEVLTPDSSRFWPKDKYEAGRDQESFDKQYVRNYLTELVKCGQWDKTPPGPQLPEKIVKNTAAKYREACELLMDGRG
ncbi:MAG: phosphoribosylaminoimidazolesuccinocarboxamide synthase [Phycisphaerae bacterium]|nr:phosphoribosylaminoimidazolesuccinocarboxamide synthase [Phycisphaerales bacterium]